MEILECGKVKNQELTKVEKYKMTKSEMTSIKDVEDGYVLKVTAYSIFEDENSKGELNTILSIATDSGLYATQSETFRKNFLDMWELFAEDEEELPIIKKSGYTKSDRPFVTCELGLQ